MLNNLVEDNIRFEKERIGDLKQFTLEEVNKSKLSLFTKKFIEFEEDKEPLPENIETLIEKAVKLNFNYTIRPKWTILSFLYGTVESRPSAEVVAKLGIFQFYKYYKELITNYIKDNSLIFITKEQVSNLIDEADFEIYKKLVNNISNVKIKNFFKQLFKLKYFSENEINLESSILYSLIRIFLEDKSYLDLLSKFDVIPNLTDNTEVALKDIIKILTNKYPSIGNKIQSEKEVIEVSFNDKDTSLKKIDSLKSEHVTFEREKESFNNSNSEFIDTNVSLKKETISSQVLIKESEQNKNIHSEYKNKSSKNSFVEHESNFKESNDIENLFHANELKDILKQVYDMNYPQMSMSFEKMVNFENWNMVRDYLKELFIKNNVDIYNPIVVKYVNKLNEFFLRKENNF